MPAADLTVTFHFQQNYTRVKNALEIAEFSPA